MHIRIKSDALAFFQRNERTAISRKKWKLFLKGNNKSTLKTIYKLNKIKLIKIFKELKTFNLIGKVVKTIDSIINSLKLKKHRWLGSLSIV